MTDKLYIHRHNSQIGEVVVAVAVEVIVAVAVAVAIAELVVVATLFTTEINVQQTWLGAHLLQAKVAIRRFHNRSWIFLAIMSPAS